MSMYDLVVGDGLQRYRGMALVNGLLGIEDVGRYRDAWLEKHPEHRLVVAVYTRNGGLNRECWKDSTEEGCTCYGCVITDVLPEHPLYLRDEDDDFDCTYATIWFKLPDPLPVEWAFLAEHEGEEPVNMSDKWLDAIDKIKNGAL